MTDGQRKLLTFIVIGAVVVACSLIYFAIYPWARDGQGNKDATVLSAIVLIGLALTLVLVAILAATYSAMGYQNPTQALGLPEGSVRALLAFSLVLIFVCLSAFLYSESNVKQCEKCGNTMEHVTEAQLADLRANFTVAAEQAIGQDGKPLFEQIPVSNQTNPSSPARSPKWAKNSPAPALAPIGQSSSSPTNWVMSAAGAPPGGASAPAPPSHATETPAPTSASVAPKTADDVRHPIYRVTYYPKENREAMDFAKQIFTTLATIFVSVVSFYFGSSVTTSAVKAGADAANQTGPGTTTPLVNPKPSSQTAADAGVVRQAGSESMQDTFPTYPEDEQRTHETG